jgi:hypothetical protein
MHVGGVGGGMHVGGGGMGCTSVASAVLMQASAMAELAQ